MTESRSPQPDADEAVSRSAAAGTEQVLPVMVESASVRLVPQQVGAVRVRIEVDEIEQAVPGDAVSMRVDVERVPRGTVVSRTRAPWQEGDDLLVVPVYEERVVLGRELVLVEELHLRTTSVKEARMHDVRLRRERAVVERLQPDGRWVSSSDMDDSDDPRQARDHANSGPAPASERKFT